MPIPAVQPSGRRKPVDDDSDVEEDDNTKVAQKKNTEAWNALKRFGQPLIVVSCVGAGVLELRKAGFTGDYGSLIEPAVSFPLAGLALASCVNFSVDDPAEIFKNYAFFAAKGLLVSTAIVLSDPSKIFFSKLNEGWLKDIFTGNMLHEQHGFGFRTMVLFHTINLFTNSRLVKLIYG
jgi:hypothetical protein